MVGWSSSKQHKATGNWFNPRPIHDFKYIQSVHIDKSYSALALLQWLLILLAIAYK